MAYIWGWSNKIPDFLTCIIDKNLVHDCTTDKLKAGNKIIKSVLRFTINNTKRKVKPDQFYKFDLINDNTGVPLVNTKALKILEKEFLGKFQAIPAIIQLPDSSEINDYWVINVTNKLPCFLLNHSLRHERFKDDQDIRASIFYTIAYDANIIEKEGLCRDSILEENLIFISERLYNIFKKEKIKGGGFFKNLRDSVVFV